MIYTSVIPCLSSGLAKITKLCPYVLFSGSFGQFESLAFSRKWGQTLHQSSVFSQFFKGTIQ